MDGLLQGYSGYHREASGDGEARAKSWQPVPMMPIHAARAEGQPRALCGAPLLEVTRHGWPSSFGACRECIRVSHDLMSPA